MHDCRPRQGTQLRTLTCVNCNLNYHSRCFKRSKNKRESKRLQWFCNNCALPIKVKCNHCKKTIAENNLQHRCKNCSAYFHKKCLSEICHECLKTDLPFSGIDNTSLRLMNEGMESAKEKLKQMPKFKIKTVDIGPHRDINIETDEFLTNNIKSGYYSPDEFLLSKFSTEQLSVFHINISSLQAHIDELKLLLNVLNFHFDIIAISETRLHSTIPERNIDIEGYTFEHTPTSEQCGGVGMYIKNSLVYEVVDSISKAENGLCDSLFVEIKNIKKSPLVGCIYRHHASNIKNFSEKSLSDFLQFIDDKNKSSILMGDFNADLLNIEKHNDTHDYYDMLSSSLFRPVILQPTRVTATTATLIDNIFVNELDVSSIGGNITTTLSDHFVQFCILDCYNSKHNKPTPIYKRSYKNFSDDEFRNELNYIRWNDIFQNKNGAECTTALVNKVDELMDQMAPIRKLTKKEASLEKCPWMTGGLLKSIKTRDMLHKKYTKEKDAEKRSYLHAKYKAFRNKTLTLIRQSKNNYYMSFFETNQTNIKNVWKEIRKIVNIKKKSGSVSRSFKIGNEYIDDQKRIADEFNIHFSSIGKKFKIKLKT